ncbi:hypothetical protein E4T47_06000 [Aureobasidium subglaciale]|nr:hypothetical protein E4T47_06000 [Aureobasidium subglaciale]
MHYLKEKTSGTLYKEAKTQKPATPRVTYIDYKCSLCNGVNTFRSDTQAPTKRSKTPRSAVESKSGAVPSLVSNDTATIAKSALLPTATPSPAPSSTISSSSEQARGGVDKKKNRKQKLGGLQAMLAKSKAPASAPKAFDFMDFMKTT